MISFPTRVAKELTRARTKHSNMHTLHEGYAVLLEEMDELWNGIKSKHPSLPDVLEELVQVAAMAQRFAEDVLPGQLKGNR